MLYICATHMVQAGHCTALNYIMKAMNNCDVSMLYICATHMVQSGLCTALNYIMKTMNKCDVSMLYICATRMVQNLENYNNLTCIHYTFFIKHLKLNTL
jgi:hypothetical protein